MADERLRLFVAVPLPPAALEACRSLIEPVQAHPVHGIRWVRTENLHITLRFLGATGVDAVPAIGDAVRAAATGRHAFDVVLGGAGAFPAAGRARTLWIGITEGADRLADLAAALDGRLAGLGWPGGRPFRPHLTVARTDAAPRAEGRAAGEAIASAAADRSIGFRADRLTLFRSHLGAGPPRYEPLLEAVLDA